MYNEYEKQVSATREETQRIRRLLIYSVSCIYNIDYHRHFSNPFKNVLVFLPTKTMKKFMNYKSLYCVFISCKFISMEFKCTLKSRFSNVRVQNADQYAVGESKVK